MTFRRMRASRTVAVAVLSAVALTSAIQVRAENRDSAAPKPILVVWAKTDLPNQDAPTLDLGRHFVSEPTKLGVTSVAISSIVDIPDPDRIPLLVIAAVMSVVVIVVVRIRLEVEAEGRLRQLRKLQASWDKRLEDAKTKQLESDNFSDAWLRAAARERCGEILNGAAALRRAEAERQVRARQQEAEHRQIARYASQALGLDEAKVMEMLRQSDLLDFRLLAEAIRITEGRS